MTSPAPVPDTLRAVLLEVAAASELDARGLDAILRRHPKDGRGFHTKREILDAYRRDPGAVAVSEAQIAERLRTCPTRSLSGVLPVTVLTKPFPCPGRCVFCPSDVRMPRSYLAEEPGCQRAEANRFDPAAQVVARLDAYLRMGHPLDKVELIVLGGTWSHYPVDYQRWFVARCFDALNAFGRADEVADAGSIPLGGPDPARAADGPDFRALAASLAPSDVARPGAYDRIVARQLRARHAGRLLAPEESADWDAVERAQRANESARCRCVGLSVETRPDRIDAAEAGRLRRLGVTKVQLGVQSLDDAVLARSRRGHDAGASRRAFSLLRGAALKIQAHWMPNLLGATPESDARDFTHLFDDPALRPDELKIYPCSLIETAELAVHHARGEWRPYETDTLVDLLAGCLERVPAYCRVTRVIRDIPSPQIAAGNRRTNLREDVEARLHAQGRDVREIRAREVRGRAVDPATVALHERHYGTGIGREVFVEARTHDDRLAGFARVALPDTGRTTLPELSGSALLREVHVYGRAAELGSRAAAGRRAQHAGLGTRLVERAAGLAAAHGFGRLSVVSAVGTRPWYRGLGFSDGSLYQTRATGS